MSKLASISKILAFAMLMWTLPATAQQPPSQAALDETVKVYCDAWGESNLDRRREMLERVWTPGGTYTDPVSHVEGRDALVKRITGFLEKFPGAKIVPSSRADLHHDVLRFTWRLESADGKTLNEGIDFGEIAKDGRLRRIVGFFGPIKPL
jgi:SnoaL-like protein